MKFEEKKMVNWYDVGQLTSTGIKTVISGIFGNFADKREFQATNNPQNEFFDFSKTEENSIERKDIWIDYISDLGDGFDATYTMAHLIAQDYLEVDNTKLQRGDILIMGGDEVYPTPEMHEYNNRLKGPYKAAYPWKENDNNRPKLFAIPGNHDWYDGLTNFTKVFFQKRAIGNWKTVQERSYFALKLPHNYWLIGIDISLNGDIDFPQIEYFRKIAKESFQENDKIILCTAEPTWVFRSWADKERTHDKIGYFINEILLGKSNNDYKNKNEQVQIITILSGDLHHYSRYIETNKENGNIRHLITAGGGGAFTHPTHVLENIITSEEGNVGTLVDSTFPSKKDSKKLGWLNLLFPAYSIAMTLFLGCYHLLTAWFIQSNSNTTQTFIEKSIQLDFSFSSYFNLIIENLSHNPSAVILNFILFIGLILFADNKTNWGNWNRITGGIHGVIQITCFYLLFYLFVNFNNSIIMNGKELNSWLNVLLFSFEMILFGGLLSSFIFGLYLLFSITVAKNHATEAFSSFRWKGYKNFLRIHIDKNGDVNLYAIGVKKVVTDWKNNSNDKNKPSYSGSKIKYQLIEKPFKLNKS